MFEPSDISRDATDAEVFKTSPQRNLLNLLGLVIFLFLFIPGILGRSTGRSEDLIHWIASSPWRLHGAVGITSVPIFISLWCLVRPVTLITNGSGFVLTGGFIGSSKTQSWDDVEHFFVTSVGSKERVACALRPDAERRFRARRGASHERAILAGFFPADPNQIVARLNAFRQRAVGDIAVPDALSDGADLSQGTGGAIEPKIVRSTRWLYVVTVAILSSPMALLALADIKTGHIEVDRRLLLYMMVIIPFLLGALWFAVRPPALVLDQTGFTLTGGFTRSPQRTRWGDVQDFLVYNPPRNRLPKIAYDSRCDVPSESDLRKRVTRKVLYFFFVLKADDVVNQLNAYRERALRLAS